MSDGRTLWVALLLTAAGCRDSPREVLESASAAAAGGDLAVVQESFSITTVHRLERNWELKQINQTEGWRVLAGKLTFQGEPLEVLEEHIAGELAKVDARAGVEERDYYLRKVDGRWRIELGAGTRYRKARTKEGKADPAKADPAEQKKAADSG